jgi:hypothetical protein
MYSFDVVGYVDCDCIVCPNCATPEEMEDPNGLPVIFADSEWDSYPVCDRCGSEITDVCLTEIGIDYIETIDKIAVDVSDLRRSFFNPYLGKETKVIIEGEEYSGFEPAEMIEKQNPGLYNWMFGQWLRNEISENVLYKDRNGDYFANMSLLKERNR